MLIPETAEEFAQVLKKAKSIVEMVEESFRDKEDQVKFKISEREFIIWCPRNKKLMYENGVSFVPFKETNIDTRLKIYDTALGEKKWITKHQAKKPQRYRMLYLKCKERWARH